MKDKCHTVTKKIEHWLELSEPEKEAVNNHARLCPTCANALAAMMPALRALDRSSTSYDQIRYTGPMPPLPLQKPALCYWRAHFPKVGWATALAAMVIFLVWFNFTSTEYRDVDRRPPMTGTLRISSIPSFGKGTNVIPMTPGSLIRRLPKPQYPIGPSLRTKIQTPHNLKHRNANRRKTSACANGITHELKEYSNLDTI